MAVVPTAENSLKLRGVAPNEFPIQETKGNGDSLMEIEKQKVYRCISTDSNGGGTRMWDVRQVIGEPTPGTMTNYGVQDRNGEWWYITCAHSWSDKFILAYMDEPDDRWESVEWINPSV